MEACSNGVHDLNLTKFQKPGEPGFYLKIFEASDLEICVWGTKMAPNHHIYISTNINLDDS